MTAAGLHPFTGTPIPPKRTLLVDLENPPSIVQRKTQAPCSTSPASSPGGTTAARGSTRAPAASTSARPPTPSGSPGSSRGPRPTSSSPGPLYKMTIDGGERAEQLHSAVAAFWNPMRERHGVALWLEAHAPMAQSGSPRDLRPLGSGVWQRWPEFGKTLRADSSNRNELVIGRYRGDRDERQWPERLTRPAYGEPRRWPWKAQYPEGTFGPEKAA